MTAASSQAAFRGQPGVRLHRGHPVKRNDLRFCVLLVLFVGVVSLLVRPLIPVDETRYISVAWEMWSNGSWYLPTKNLEPYAHKPPLLFWLIQAGWWAFGVNEWWPRMISPLLAAVNALLVAQLAQALWPQRDRVGALAAIVYTSSWCLLVLSTALMFDMLMSSCVLLAALGLVRARALQSPGWSLFVVGIALGLLAKGPVVLVYLLPVAAAVRLWARGETGRARWHWTLVGAIVLACVPITLWLLAVANETGAAQLRELIVEQSLARVRGEMGHGRPFWWYVPWWVLVPMPWLLWPAFWRNLRAVQRDPLTDSGLRFVAVAVISACLILSVVGGKQVHYLLPVWALAAPAMGRILSEALPVRPLDLLWPALVVLVFAAVLWLPIPIKHPDIATLVVQVRPWLTQALWGVCVVGALAAGPLGHLRVIQFGSAAVIVALLVCVFPFLRSRYDLTQPAALVARLQAQGHPVAFVGLYQAEFGFTGRLTAPLEVVDAEQAASWSALHPDGVLVGRSKRLRVAGAAVQLRTPYRSDELVIVSADQFLANRHQTMPGQWHLCGVTP